MLGFLVMLFFTLAAGTPFLLPERCAIVPGKPQGVYMCESPNWNGKCVWKLLNTCIRAGSRSIGPDPGTFCQAYWTQDCSGEVVWWDVYESPKEGRAEGGIMW
jgi:hypothetical protein